MRYTLAEGLMRCAWDPPYEVPTNEPKASRQLRVFSLDPSVSRTQGAVSTISIPFEPCTPGPVSGLFEIDLRDEQAGDVYTPLDLDDPEDLRTGAGGRQPDAADPMFHAQMVYAIALLTYESFRRALGRHLSWGFHGDQPRDRTPLRILPFADRTLNAWYSRGEQAIGFGYRPRGSDIAAGSEDLSVYTALNSDIVTHEIAHALIDGLKPYFWEPTNPDVGALHEALADLVALFQRFTYTELVTEQLARQRGRLDSNTLLKVLAPQIGRVLARERGLRTFESLLSAIENGEDVHDRVRHLQDLKAEEANQSHLRGQIFAEAIFDAFETILIRKTEPIILLATKGRGELPRGRISTTLLGFLVHETKRTAAQFLTICIRALDYCPPVHVEFGDYVRAMITADAQLIKYDPLGFREAITMACLLRGIVPRYVDTPSESALRWHPPPGEPLILEGLDLSSLQFRGDPAIVRCAAEVERQARLVGEALAQSPLLRERLGLAEPDGAIDPPEIVSIRSSRRVGPDDQVAFDLIIEIVQTSRIDVHATAIAWRGGATIVLDSRGVVRFIIRKRVDQKSRLTRGRQWLDLEENRMALRASASEKPSMRLYCP